MACFPQSLAFLEHWLAAGQQRRLALLVKLSRALLWMLLQTCSAYLLALPPALQVSVMQSRKGMLTNIGLGAALHGVEQANMQR
jgi:hypothetical protein